MAILAAAISLLTSILMVSTIPYYSFKEIDFKGKVPFIYLILMIIVFVAIAANPSLVLFFGFLIYAFSGLVQHYLNKCKAKRSNQDKGKIPPTE